jgi:hypothetical protein
LQNRKNHYGLLPLEDLPAHTHAAVDTSIIEGNYQTDSYTLVLSDKGKCVEINNAAAKTLTVPLNSSVDFPVGVMVELMQFGDGQITITKGGTMTFRSPDGMVKTAKKNACVTLRQRATNDWSIEGDLAV